MTKRIIMAVSSLALGLFACLSAKADTFTWNHDVAGTWDWEDASKWTKTSGSGTQTFPSVAGDVALMTSGTANITINLNTDRTLGQLTKRTQCHIAVGTPGGRLIMDNNGATALIKNVYDAWADSYIYPSIEVVGSLRVWCSGGGPQPRLEGGVIGDASATVYVKSDTYLRNNGSFYGTIVSEDDGIDGNRGWLISTDADVGPAAQVVNQDIITIQYPISNAKMNVITNLPGTQLELLDGPWWAFQPPASLTNVIDPSRFIPRFGGLLLNGNTSDNIAWGDAEPMRLDSADVWAQYRSERVGDLSVAGHCALAISAGALRNDKSDDKVFSASKLSLSRGGLFQVFGFNPYVWDSDGWLLLTNASATSVDDVLAPAYRHTLANGVEMTDPRIRCFAEAAKVVAGPFPSWSIERFAAGDYTTYAGAGANDYATITSATTLDADKTFYGLKTSVNINSGVGTQITLVGGVLLCSEPSWTSVTIQPTLIFGNSTSDRRDGVIGSPNTGCSLILNTVYANDLYAVVDQYNAGLIRFDGAMNVASNLYLAGNSDKGGSLTGGTVAFNNTASGLERNVIYAWTGRTKFAGQTIGGLVGGARLSSTEFSGNTTLTISNGVDCVFDGNVYVNAWGWAPGYYETLGVTKIGPAKQTFNGTSFGGDSLAPLAPAGDAKVHQGTLEINGSFAKSASVYAGAAGAYAGGTLAGVGTLGTNVVIASGGTLAPGRSGVGTLNALTNVTLQAGSTFKVELAGTSSYDRLAIDGQATITGGTIDVTLLGGYTPKTSTKHTIISTTGGFVGTPSFTGITQGYTWAVEGNNIVLTVPPKGTMVMLR